MSMYVAANDVVVDDAGLRTGLIVCNIGVCVLSCCVLCLIISVV